MEQVILLDAGSGGRASQRLITDIFLAAFGNSQLEQMNDAALLEPLPGKIAMSTDAYTVSPLFFPGGSIGTLAVNGTVNDVSMLGAIPRWLAAAFIIEEGLQVAELEHIASDMARACQETGVQIVTGDTKVVPKGACDGVFITTTGIGHVIAETAPAGSAAQSGDVILLSGAVGDHGLTVMASREGASFLSDTVSDCAPLAAMIQKLFASNLPVHVLRDPTRGGLATTLNEIAEQSGQGIEIDEDRIPVHRAVDEGCSFLGLDPLYLANEGKCVCILPADRAEEALQIMRASPYGKEATLIGKVVASRPGKVILNTRMGGQRFLGMLEGAPLPRIC